MSLVFMLMGMAAPGRVSAQTEEENMKDYSLRESANILGVKVRTLREWIRSGKINARKHENGWYWRISEEEIMKHGVGKD